MKYILCFPELATIPLILKKIDNSKKEYIGKGWVKLKRWVKESKDFIINIYLSHFSHT